MKRPMIRGLIDRRILVNYRVQHDLLAHMLRAFGLCWLNCCRLIDVVNESGPIRRFGFAYGTLPGHIESGEEKFVIE